MVNPVFEKPLYGGGHDQGFEFGYRNGAYYRWMRYLSPGVEFYGGIGLIDDNDPLRQQQHYIFPVVWGELPHGIEYNVGPGFGLTAGSDHVIMKFNVGFGTLSARSSVHPPSTTGFSRGLRSCYDRLFDGVSV